MARILVIEGDPAVRQAIALVIDRLGYAVAPASDAAQGILMAEAGNFDLAVVDMTLPGVDGLEAIQAVARFVPPIPILAIAPDAVAAGEDRAALALQYGASAVLSKPFRREELLQAIADTMLEVRTAE